MHVTLTTNPVGDKEKVHTDSSFKFLFPEEQHGSNLVCREKKSTN